LSHASVRTELECDWEASQNKAVFPEFTRSLHVSPDPLVYDPERPLIVGIDMPGTPAAVVTQVDMWGRWCVLATLCPPEEETVGVWEFGEALAELLLRDYAEPHGRDLDTLSVRFYGDPAGAAPIPKPGQSAKEARSCFDILRHGVKLHKGYDERGRELVEEKPGWGWAVIPGEVSINKRLEAVRARLTTLLRDGVPAFAVDPCCRTLIEALAGAYCYRQRSSDLRYELDPDKSWHSHVADALAYPATRLFARTIKEPRDEDRKRRRSGSGASARQLRMG
jgi:hypothetical protein